MTKAKNRVIDAALKAGACSNHIFQGYLLCYHEISATEFDNMRADYFRGANLLDPVQVNIDLSKACKNNHQEFWFEDKNTDNIISPQVVKGGDGSINTPKPPAGKQAAKYSLALMQAIFTVFEPDSIWVSKAISPMGDKTIAIKVVKGGQDVYYCDLSHEFPLPRIPEHN